MLGGREREILVDNPFSIYHSGDMDTVCMSGGLAVRQEMFFHLLHTSIQSSSQSSGMNPGSSKRKAFNHITASSRYCLSYSWCNANAVFADFPFVSLFGLIDPPISDEECFTYSNRLPPLSLARKQAFCRLILSDPSRRYALCENTRWEI